MIWWILGLSFSLIFGHLFMMFFTIWLDDEVKLPKPEGPRVPPSFPGWVERLFFTILIGINSTAAPAMMLGWLGLKLATNWNHRIYDNDVKNRTYGFLALIKGLTSMTFALIGGIICAHK